MEATIGDGDHVLAVEGDAQAHELTGRGKTNSAELCKIELEPVHGGTFGRTMETLKH
jgi:hypothetical protein